jgi:hypothetical protein
VVILDGAPVPDLIPAIPAGQNTLVRADVLSRRSREGVSPLPGLSPYRASTDLLAEYKAPKFVPGIVPTDGRELRKIADNYRHMENRKSLEGQWMPSICKNLQEYPLFL